MNLKFYWVIVWKKMSLIFRILKFLNLIKKIKDLVKEKEAKEEENKKVKGASPSRSSKTTKVPDKKGKPERVTTAKNKNKIRNKR